MPRALLLNKDNFIEWKGTGFDLHAAESIMLNAMTSKLEKKKDFEAHELQKELTDLIQQSKTMVELRMIIKQFATYMTAPTLISAMGQVRHTNSQASSNHKKEVMATLESLLSFLEPSIPGLHSGQLAAVLSSISRAEQTPTSPETSIMALQERLRDESEGLGDVDPRTLAALVSSAQKVSSLKTCHETPLTLPPQLDYGDKVWWISASRSISSNLPLMQPEDARRVMYAAASNVVSQASSSSPAPHRFTPEDPFSSAFWSKAETSLAQRIRSNELDDPQAAGILRSFSLAASHLQRGKVGSEVWSALSERLKERQGVSADLVLMPPSALVDLAWSCAVMKEGFGWQGNSNEKGQEDPSLSFFLSTIFTSATHTITHFNLKQIESLLSAAAIALDGRKGEPHPLVLPPLSTMTAMVSDVIEIRAFEWQGSGAIPSSLGTSESSQHRAASACHVLHLLAKLGHFEALGLKLGKAKKSAMRDPLALPPQVATRSSLLKALYAPAKSLLLPSSTSGTSLIPLSSPIGIEATCNLLNAYAKAGPMAPNGSSFILATLAAQRELSPSQISAATWQSRPKQVVKALVALLRAASDPPSFPPPLAASNDTTQVDKRAADRQVGQKALVEALNNLANLVSVAPVDTIAEPRAMKELRDVLGLESSTSLLRDHQILKFSTL